MTLEMIKFELNFPMLLLFPKWHFLARFAMPWPFFMCMQIISKGFKDKCEHLHNKRTRIATSKCNSLPILTCPSSLLPLFLNTSLLLLLLFWWDALTCSSWNGLSPSHGYDVWESKVAYVKEVIKKKTKTNQKATLCCTAGGTKVGKDEGLSSSGSELTMQGRAPHSPFREWRQEPPSWHLGSVVLHCSK